MYSRYKNRNIVVNNSKEYKTVRKDRGLSRIRQYTTKKMKYPTSKQISRMKVAQHVWRIGDRYHKLANQYYGDGELWWVIAWFNQKPTEFHVRNGELIYIPTNLEEFIAAVE